VNLDDKARSRDERTIEDPVGTPVIFVFGDLHGRVLPAFRLATLWAREHRTPVRGILQAGDLGYFPDLSRLDKATRRHAETDPLELGIQDIVAPSTLADAVFNDPECPPAMWFTAGNHEDHDALRERERVGLSADRSTFPADFYRMARCIRDGHVARLPQGLRVGALWGIDPDARPHTLAAARIDSRSVSRLAAESFDVLLAHDGPRDAIMPGAGSAEISTLLDSVGPALAFFGHYGSPVREVENPRGPTRVYHLAGFELRHRGEYAEPGSCGILRRNASRWEFDYVSDAWLSKFTRHTWPHW
jgi:hypothetical protein